MKKRFTNVAAVKAGILIGLASLISLQIDNKYCAAICFSVGLLAIRILGLPLFTGQIQFLKDKTINIKILIRILFENYLGVWLIFVLAILTQWMPYELMVEYYVTKWTQPYLYYLGSGFFCGILMTIATKKETPLWISALCVITFILAGFNHCIADMFYLTFTPKVLLSWLFVVIGNIFGGYLIA